MPSIGHSSIVGHAHFKHVYYTREYGCLYKVFQNPANGKFTPLRNIQSPNYLNVLILTYLWSSLKGLVRLNSENGHVTFERNEVT